MITFKTISENSKAEIIEKKSRFICYAFYIESEEEAEKYIEEIKKEYYDARHHVYAYSIYSKDGNIVTRFSDDGEPSGTAGKPILKIINEQGISNVLLIVIRYFGGILLGTGGLVRAYSQSSLEALKKVKVIEKMLGYEVKIYVDYKNIESIKYYLDKNNIKTINIQYLENIEITIEISETNLYEFTNNGNKNIFKNLKYDILNRKYVDI